MDCLPELVLAEVHVPDCKFVAASLSFPHVVVSASDEVSIFQRCFEGGALDFILKPIRKSELHAKIDHVITKIPPIGAAPTLGFQLDTLTLTVRRAGSASIQLTAREIQIFTLLQRAHGQGVQRSLIQRQVWGGLFVSEKTLDVHLFNLRRKLVAVGLEILFISSNSYMLVEKSK